MKQYEIKLECNEAFYKALVLMLRYMKCLGSQGASRKCSICFDGDGSDKISQMFVSENVSRWRVGVEENGNFELDTDEIYALQRGDHKTQKPITPMTGNCESNTGGCSGTL